MATIDQVVRRLLDEAHGIEPGSVPRVVAEHARSAGFDDVEVFLVDHRQEHLQSASGPDRHAIEGTNAGDAYRRERARVVDEGDRSRVWVPLVDGEDRLGVFTAVVDDATEEVVDDLHLLSAVTAGLIVSKQAYTDVYEFVRRDEPMDLAAEFRWALLPPLTMWTPRVQVAGMLEPAYEIAGDAFEYSANDDILHVGIFDAVGHGMTACRIANLGVAVYRNCRRHGHDLPETAAAIDGALVEEFGESWFVTAMLGQLDVEHGAFRWLSAGHPAPLLLRGGKVVRTLEAKPGMPLGLEGPTPQVSEAQLEPGDTIFAYSDGVTEARSDDGDFFGEARLADYLERSAADGLPPAETVRRLVRRLYEHRPRPLQDDATMLMLTWRRSDAATDAESR